MASIVVESVENELLRYYRHPALTNATIEALKRDLSNTKFPKINHIDTEYLFLIQLNDNGIELRESERHILKWLLSETYEPEKTGPKSYFIQQVKSKPLTPNNLNVDINSNIWEFGIGPRLSFVSAFSTNAVSICEACGISNIERIEKVVRYQVHISDDNVNLSEETKNIFLSKVHDRMTEMVLPDNFNSFGEVATPEPVKIVPILKDGKQALKEISDLMGLAFDDWDLEFYTNLFRDVMKRDPTDVECFDMAQGNSEHSRHWFFGGKMIIDNVEKKQTLFSMVKQTLKDAQAQRPKELGDDNSVIAFHDNSSAIRGYDIRMVGPSKPGEPGPMKERKRTYHPLLTAETHNFPTGVAPFPGATTGTGGRLRDVMATGRGANCIAGTAAYCVGNLNIPGHDLPWEDKTKSKFEYPPNLASPLNICIEASNGASDYGNKFGEPVVAGFTRSFGLRDSDGERREWIKPIMFTAGIGQLDDKHLVKDEPAKGMLIIKIGGPCYRIGMGGGAASSRMQDAKDADLDFDAVQRGDAEMGNKVNRLVRGCIELGDSNPILSIHDQGAGGNSNVLKEIAEPAGCRLELRDILIGDNSLSVLEIWGSEYQENNALLIQPESLDVFSKIATRENCPFAVLGVVTGDGRVVLHDSNDDSTPVNLELDKILGSLPQKTFVDTTKAKTAKPVDFSGDILFVGKNKRAKSMNAIIDETLDRVLRLLQVGSKRFLTTKVDRSVTGLIAQQQCVGPLHTPLANVGVLAQSHFPLDEDDEKMTVTGIATSIGEQPIKGLLSNGAGVRMSVGEALTNLVWAKITALEDVKCSGNWMWAAKLPGEAANMYEAVEAVRDCMVTLGVSIDGGKDSLSMAATANGEVVKSPGTFVLSTYCTCPDVSLTITPDFKLPNGEKPNGVNGGGTEGQIVYVDLSSNNQRRLGGSALAQTYGQLGANPPDMEDPTTLKNAFKAVQELIGNRLVSAGHDRSDGGLITCLLEMSFAGNCGFSIQLPSGTEYNNNNNNNNALDDSNGILSSLYNEELGLVLEVALENLPTVLQAFKDANVNAYHIGQSTANPMIKIFSSGDDENKILLYEKKMVILRQKWESTSFALDKLQANPECVAQEEVGLTNRTYPPYETTFVPAKTLKSISDARSQYRVAIIRDEGSNGDREMASAFYAAGFEPWDIHMRDMLKGNVNLENFRGIVFVGGFSYADVLDSAKGWAGTVKFNKNIYEQFSNFRNRSDTFSLGICNGCQLMALLGYVPDIPEHNVRFLHNNSERFESRFSTVKVCDSPASKVWFKDMVGSTLGVWVAHGEGRVFFPNDDTLNQVEQSNLVPLRYVDDNGKATETYPFNPNGSVNGITSLCSPNGRHLAMMPHPERCINSWQWPWMPNQLKEKVGPVGPWLKLFQNVRNWCETTNNK